MSDESLYAALAAAGLSMVGTDPAKAAAAQAALAAEAAAAPARPTRQRPARSAADERPLVLVETQRDLTHTAMPFDADGAAGAAEGAQP